MNKKLIFLDIDGTLTPPGSNEPALDTLCGAARAAGAQLALYGHTHRARLETREGLILLNPGAIGRAARPGYAVLTVEDGRFSAELKEPGT